MAAVPGDSPYFEIVIMRHDRNNLKPEQVQPATEIVQRIISALNGISYGSVEIVIHEGRIVQIERKEKVRL